MSLHTQFVEAIYGAADLPELLREHAPEVTDLEEHRFDQSYIEFLDTMIHLSPRGPEWNERLKRRRAVLLPFCNARLLRGTVRVGEIGFTVEIDPVAGAVILWEEDVYGHAA